MSSSDLEDFRLIKTKLHRPLIPVDLVSRPQLSDWLDVRRNRPLTLVSAPAGYGKSTLISSWLDTCKYPHVWLTLDEQDNDLKVFLSYFLAAIRTVFPEALEYTRNLLGAHNQPPIKELARSLSNEINQIEDFFVFVLDDYEVIQNVAMHDFINELLIYPPQNMNLVMCTRIDPPISLVNLRAQSQLTEIRAQDLCFTKEEAHVMLQNMLGNTVDMTTAQLMEAQTEGWVTGIRLAALALRHRVGKQRIEEKPTANNRYVSDYLMSEILDKQVNTFSEWLLKTSILARFNAGLCETVCSGESEMDGGVFLERLEGSNLFAIPLDDQCQWVRYHHLFRDFLQRELVRRYDTAEIATFHMQASNWFDQNGLIDEAIDHALAAGDLHAAAQIVERNRHTILDKDQWYVLKKWLARFPDEIKQQRPEFMLAEAWVLQFQFDLPAIISLMDTVENTLEDAGAEPAEWQERDGC
jgi:LuxR family maltose regulon positive regulatory protein